MELTDKQKEVLAVDSHLLVTGGPGSGKTTISILKAAKIAADDLYDDAVPWSGVAGADRHRDVRRGPA